MRNENRAGSGTAGTLLIGGSTTVRGAGRAQRRAVEGDLAELVDPSRGAGVDRPAGEHRVAEPQLGVGTDVTAPSGRVPSTSSGLVASGFSTIVTVRSSATVICTCEREMAASGMAR